MFQFCFDLLHYESESAMGMHYYICVLEQALIFQCIIGASFIFNITKNPFQISKLLSNLLPVTSTKTFFLTIKQAYKTHTLNLNLIFQSNLLPRIISCEWIAKFISWRRFFFTLSDFFIQPQTEQHQHTTPNVIIYRTSSSRKSEKIRYVDQNQDSHKLTQIVKVSVELSPNSLGGMYAGSTLHLLDNETTVPVWKMIKQMSRPNYKTS